MASGTGNRRRKSLSSQRQGLANGVKGGTRGKEANLAHRLCPSVPLEKCPWKNGNLQLIQKGPFPPPSPVYAALLIFLLSYPFNHRYPSNLHTHLLVAPASAPRSFTAHHNYQRVRIPRIYSYPRPSTNFKRRRNSSALRPHKTSSKCSSRASSPSWPLASLWLPPRKPPTPP